MREADRERAKRAALRALRKASAAAEKSGAKLSDWEGEFLGSVEGRLKTYGRAFADPEKGALASSLSIRQTVKVKEIAAKAKGEKPENRLSAPRHFESRKQHYCRNITVHNLCDFPVAMQQILGLLRARAGNTRVCVRESKERGVMASAEAKPQLGSLQRSYEIGEIPPLGHVPKNMYAWAIRKDRHGSARKSMQIEVVPTWTLDRHDVLDSRDGGGRELQRRVGRARHADLAHRWAQKSVSHRGLRCVRHRVGRRHQSHALESRR